MILLSDVLLDCCSFVLSYEVLLLYIFIPVLLAYCILTVLTEWPKSVHPHK